MEVKRTCLLPKVSLNQFFQNGGDEGQRLTEESSLPDSKVGIFKSSCISSITNTFEHHFIYLLAISFTSDFSSILSLFLLLQIFPQNGGKQEFFTELDTYSFIGLSLGYMYWYYLDKCIKTHTSCTSFKTIFCTSSFNTLSIKKAILIQCLSLSIYFDIKNFVLLLAWCIFAHSFVCLPLNIPSSFSTSVKIIRYHCGSYK